MTKRDHNLNGTEEGVVADELIMAKRSLDRAIKKLSKIGNIDPLFAKYMQQHTNIIMALVGALIRKWEWRMEDE